MFYVCVYIYLRLSPPFSQLKTKENIKNRENKIKKCYWEKKFIQYLKTSILYLHFLSQPL